MGSPSAVALANNFMGFYESKWLNEYNINKPKFYSRYVCDILAIRSKSGKEQYRAVTSSNHQQPPSDKQ